MHLLEGEGDDRVADPPFAALRCLVGPHRVLGWHLEDLGRGLAACVVSS